MGVVKCIDAVSMVVEEATKRFAPLWTVNKDNYSILEQYCSVIDSLAEEFDCEAFDVSVDGIRMTIAISLECNDIVIDSSTHIFYSLVQHSKSIGFSVSEDGNLNITFVFPSVWERT